MHSSAPPRIQFPPQWGKWNCTAYQKEAAAVNCAVNFLLEIFVRVSHRDHRHCRTFPDFEMQIYSEKSFLEFLRRHLFPLAETREFLLQNNCRDVKASVETSELPKHFVEMYTALYLCKRRHTEQDIK
jgi:hypothetical protein